MKDKKTLGQKLNSLFDRGEDWYEIIASDENGPTLKGTVIVTLFYMTLCVLLLLALALALIIVYTTIVVLCKMFTVSIFFGLVMLVGIIFCITVAMVHAQRKGWITDY